MRKNFSPSMLGHGADRSGDVSPHSAVKISLEGELQTRFSPDMRPRPLSSVGTPSTHMLFLFLFYWIDHDLNQVP